MAEYIEREALIAKAKTLPLGRGELWTASERPKFVSLADVVKAPAAEVAPVVRCKDCKHYDTGSYGAEEMICTFWAEHLETNPDDFCSYGERRDSDG